MALSSPAVKHLWLMRERFRFIDTVLYYVWADADTTRNLFVVPQDMRDEVLFHCHDSVGAGHMGRSNTYYNLKKSFYWYRMFDAVENYIRTCAACSVNKRDNHTKRAPQVQFHAGAPMERVHIDILGPFTKTPQGNTCILMMVDQFTKWVESFPLPDQTAEHVAQVLVDQFFTRFGCPVTIHTDQGTNFTGHIFTEMCRMLQIAKTRTSPYRPCSNGQCERYNRTLIEMVRCLQKRDIREWDKYVPHVASAIRSIRNRTTGFSANRMMLGRELSRPVDILYGLPATTAATDRSDFINNLERVLRESHLQARKNIGVGMGRQKRDYDLTAYTESYEVGDLVYKLRSGVTKGISRKLLSIYEGPFLVTEVLPPVLFRIEGRKRSVIVHHDKLKPCNDRFIPFWLRRRRHEFLSLDETIPYDVNEQSEGDDLGLGGLF